MDGNTEDLQKFVPQVHFEQIPIKNLCSNQDYQRNLSIKHVQRAATNFDLYQINPVKVSRRDGINYVFNGQHTIEIVALVSGSRETPVWCMVYDDLVYFLRIRTILRLCQTNSTEPSSFVLSILSKRMPYFKAPFHANTILSYPKFILRSILHLIYEYPFQIFAFTGYSFM